jgi:hypothetical protein
LGKTAAVLLVIFLNFKTTIEMEVNKYSKIIYSQNFASLACTQNATLPQEESTVGRGG